MSTRFALMVLVLCQLGTGCASRDGSGVGPDGSTTACPVTRESVPGFVPPPPYPAEPPGANGAQFWYGSAGLWTMLEPAGAWTGLPLGEGGYSQKVFWWADGYSVSEEPIPELAVTGRLLDGEAGPLIASEATNAFGDFGDAMLVGVAIPTAGCWEITGRYRGNELSFVVQVKP